MFGRAVVSRECVPSAISSFILLEPLDGFVPRDVERPLSDDGFARLVPSNEHWHNVCDAAVIQFANFGLVVGSRELPDR